MFYQPGITSHGLQYVNRPGFRIHINASKRLTSILRF